MAVYQSVVLSVVGEGRTESKPSPATDMFIFVDWGLKVGSTTRTSSSSVQFSLLPWVVHTNVSNLDVQAHAHKDEVQDDQIVTKGLARFEATERNHNQGREQAQDQKGPRHLQIGDLVDRVPICIRFVPVSFLARGWVDLGQACHQTGHADA